MMCKQSTWMIWIIYDLLYKNVDLPNNISFAVIKTGYIYNFYVISYMWLTIDVVVNSITNKLYYIKYRSMCIHAHISFIYLMLKHSMNDEQNTNFSQFWEGDETTSCYIKWQEKYVNTGKICQHSTRTKV